MTGETERALWADILGAVARGWCSPENAAKVMDADLANAITAELLPLFNAGMERAVLRYEKALVSLTPLGSEYVGDPEKCAAYVRERQQSLQDQVIRQVKLRQEAEQAVAGAYAAAAKHWPIVCKFEYTGCSCGWQVSDKNTMAALDQWRQHILALTPADARQHVLPCDPNDQVSETQFQKVIWDAIASVLGPKWQILANSLQEKLTIGIRDYLRWNCERAKAHRGEK